MRLNRGAWQTTGMRPSWAWLLVAPYAMAANTPSFTASPAGGITAIATDSAGNTYIAGGAAAGSIATPGAFQTQNNSAGVCQLESVFGIVIGNSCSGSFLEKLDPEGNVVFGTFFGGNGGTSISAMAVDAAGNVYLAGSTQGQVGTGAPPNSFPVTAGAAFTNGGAFIAKLNASGSQLVYSTLLPSGTIASLAIDGAGNAYVAGTGVVPATSAAFQTAPKGSAPATPCFVAKLNASGSALVYATYVSGSGGDVATSIAVDASGDAFLTGWTRSTDFPVTPGAFLSTSPATSAGDVSIFLTKLNPQGSGLVFSTYLGNGSAPTVKLDGNGTAFVAGATSSPSFPTTAGAPLTIGGPDVPVGFLTHFSADGSALVYSTHLPMMSDQAAALDVDTVGNAVVAGAAYVANLPIGAAVFQPEYAGGTYDVYIQRFTPDGHLSGSTYLGGTLSDTAQAISLMPNGSVVVAGYTMSPAFPGIAQVGANGAPFVTNIFPSLTILNAASYVATAVAPGEIVALKGYGMGPATGVVAAGAVLPTQFGGAQITFGTGFDAHSFSFPAPLIYVQAEQINAQIPWELAGQASATLLFEALGSTDPIAMNVVVAPSIPGIFFVNNADGSANSPSNPTQPDELISIYGTGGGETNPAGSTGQFWPLAPLAALTLPVSVTIGGENAAVVYSGSAPTLESGFFQINAILPGDLASGPAPLTVSIGGMPSVAVPVSIGTH